MRQHYSYEDNFFNFHYSVTAANSGINVSVHTHMWNEIYVFLGGKNAYKKIEGTLYPLHSGDIIITRDAESHSMELDPSEPYERFSLHFNPEIIMKIDPEGSLLKPFNERPLGKLNLYSPSDFPSPLASMLMESMMQQSSDPHRHLTANLIAFLNELCTAFENKSRDNKDFSTNALGERVIAYINRHLSEDISLDTICKRYYISKPQLCRVFKTSTGSTVWEYITVKRIMNAQKMISSGIAPTRAAAMCGFNDYSVFYRAYKRRFGVCPKLSKEK